MTKKAQKRKIHAQMSISDVLSKYPETVPVFQKFGLHCLYCPLAGFETIEKLAETHQINLEIFLDELNVSVNNKTGKRKKD